MPPIDDFDTSTRLYAVDADGDGHTDLMGSNPGVWVAYQRKPYRRVPDSRAPHGNATLSSGGAIVATSGAPATAENADLSVALVHSPDAPIAGGTVTYTATTSNAGPQAAVGAALSLTTPSGTRFVSATLPGGACLTPP